MKLQKLTMLLVIILITLSLAACGHHNSKPEAMMAVQYFSSGNQTLRVPSTDRILNHRLTVAVRSTLRTYNTAFFDPGKEGKETRQNSEKPVEYHGEPFLVMVTYTLEGKQTTSSFFCDAKEFKTLTVNSTSPDNEVHVDIDGSNCKLHNTRPARFQDHIDPNDPLDYDARYDVEPDNVEFTSSGNQAFGNAKFELVTSKGKVRGAFSMPKRGSFDRIILPNPGDMSGGYTVTIYYRNGKSTTFTKTTRTGSDKTTRIFFLISSCAVGVPVMVIEETYTKGVFPQGYRYKPPANPDGCPY